jgi:L-ascorbate metabolism protein UlaG (beta-lactamase superfamily)
VSGEPNACWSLESANVTSPAWRQRTTDHFDVARQRFFNPWRDTEKTVVDLLRWWWTADPRPWPAQVENRSYPPPPDRAGRGQVAVTVVGHASVLARLGDTTILTDPHFSTHAGAFGRLGVPRVRPPGITPEALPPIAVVFVSHDHYDHLDVPSLQWLDANREPLFVTCLGLRERLRREGLQRVVELDWWETLTVHDVTLTVTPAQHWSKRGAFDQFASLWGGCFVRHRDGVSLYFAGDSGYAPCFAQVRERLGAPDAALLPIGAYEPRWIMQDNHMNPEEALRAHQDLGARTSIAMHHGYFRLGDEGFDEPLRDLEAARHTHGVTPENFRVLDVGESAVLGRPLQDRHATHR